MAVRPDEHVRHQTRLRRLAGQEPERGDRLVPRRRHRRRELPRDRDMVAHRDVEEASPVGGLRRLHELGDTGAVLALPQRRHHGAERHRRQLDPEDEPSVGDDRDDVVAHDGALIGGTHPGQTMLWSSEYAWRPNDPPSRPTPLSLVPPNGVSWLRWIVLMPTLPARRRRATRMPRAESPVKT